MIVAERYELGDLLGAGGEARVYRARDRETGVDVAIRIGERQDASWQPIAPAEHSGWVRQLDRGFDLQVGAFYTYELLRGDTLALTVARGPLFLSGWLEFVRQSLAAIAALHESGWVHGDLNAENFIFHETSIWKVLELPFHQAAPKSRSPLFGSIYTLAPEQIEGLRPTVRSDVYALGCLYYYAASGKFPHAGGSKADMAIGRLRFPPEALGALAPELPLPFLQWTNLLLARDPSQRPVDAGAALHLLPV